MRLFTAFYMVIGIYTIFMFISDAVKENFKYADELLRKRIKDSTKVGEEYRYNFFLMCANVTALVVCVLVGAIILMDLEGWTFITALYFAVQTSTVSVDS